MPEWSAEARTLLAPYVTNLDDDVYCIRNLPPEVTAVLFAYVSRSPLTFRENLATLLAGGDLAGMADPRAPVEPSEEPAFEHAARRARRFHEKWVVGYGHASVAEHADLKFALDAVSILACKALEDNRLAAYTEKSTRYQVFESSALVRPAELAGTPAGARLEAAWTRLLATYVTLQDPVRRHLERTVPRPPEASDAAWARALHAEVCDVVRYLLPAGTRTAVGVSMNARTAAHAITKLLSHPLAECRALGARMLVEGRTICPTLLRHAARSEYRAAAPVALRALAASLFAPPPTAPVGPRVRLVAFDPDGEERVLAAALYDVADRDHATVTERVLALAPAEREAVLAACTGGRAPYEAPARALEATSYTMEICCDYGAFRDIQRHRMATQLHPRLDVSLGYETPPELEEAGLAAPFHEAMATAAEAFAAIAGEHPDAAQYVVPLAFRRRTLFTWNLREIEHFVRLRSGRAGHRSYRTVAMDVADAVASVHPRLARLLTVDRSGRDLARLAAEEKAEARR